MLANVSLNDTYMTWMTRTNQLIVQQDQAWNTSNNAWAAANGVAFTAANISAQILASNSVFQNVIISGITQSGNLANVITSNTIVLGQIYASVNVFLWSANTNLSWQQANTARDQANAAFNQANQAYNAANTGSVAVAAYGQANVAFAQANQAYNAANTGGQGLIQANTARDQANAAYTQANAAYTQANTKLSNGSITLAGALTVTGLTATGSINDSYGNIRDFTLNTQTVPYGLALSDDGKMVSTNTTIYVPNAVFATGQTVSILNNSNTSLNIISNAVVSMYLVGTSNTSNTRILSQKGIATLICFAANNFIISGAGLV